MACMLSSSVLLGEKCGIIQIDHYYANTHKDCREYLFSFFYLSLSVCLSVCLSLLSFFPLERLILTCVKFERYKEHRRRSK